MESSSKGYCIPDTAFSSGGVQGGHGWATLENYQYVLALPRLKRTIYAYDHRSRSLLTDESDELPWPVMWALGRYNRKHILAGKKLPNLEDFRESLVQFEWKARWRQFFCRGSVEEQDVGGMKFVKFPGVVTPSFSGSTSIETEMALKATRVAVLRGVRHERHKAKYDKTWKNVIPLTRLGLRLLKDMQVVPIPNDKEPGYTLHSKASLTSIHEDILGSDVYEKVDPGDYDENALRRRYCCLCKEVAEHEGQPRLYNVICKMVVDYQVYQATGAGPPQKRACCEQEWVLRLIVVVGAGARGQVVESGTSSERFARLGTTIADKEG